MEQFIRSQKLFVINSYLVEIIEFDENNIYDKLPNEYGIELPFNLNKAIPKRQAEFIAGRIACHKLLKSFGNNEQVYVNTDRSPIWPKGFIGSISHDGTIACAIVQPKSTEISSIGIDLCVSMTHQNALEIANNICIFDEINQFTNIHFNKTDAVRIIFSAKESLYKAIYPIIKHFVDFKDVLINSVKGTATEGFLTFTPSTLNDNSLSIVKEFSVNYRKFNHNNISGILTIAYNSKD